MFKYNVKIQKVSGSLNESVLPNKNLVIKSKTEKSNEQLFAEASNYYKEKYGLVIESADLENVSSEEQSANLKKNRTTVLNRIIHKIPHTEAERDAQRLTRGVMMFANRNYNGTDKMEIYNAIHEILGSLKSMKEFSTTWLNKISKALPKDRKDPHLTQWQHYID